MKSKIKIDAKEALTYLTIGGGAAMGSIIAVKKAPFMQDENGRKYKSIIVPLIVMAVAYFLLARMKDKGLRYVAIAGAALPLLKGLADLMNLKVSDLIPLDLNGDTITVPLNSPEAAAIIAAYTPQERTVEGEIISERPLSAMAADLAGQSGETIDDLFGDGDDQQEEWTYN